MAEATTPDTQDQVPNGLAQAKLAFQRMMLKVKREKTAKVSGRNNTNFEYKYADLEEIHDVVLPKLSGLGLLWATRLTMDDEDRDVIAYELRHVPSGEVDAGVTRVRCAADATAQAFGSAVTYARRHALVTALNITPEDDDDGRKASQPKGAADPLLSKTGAAAMAKKLEECGVLDKARLSVASMFGVEIGDTSTRNNAAEQLRKLTKSQAQQLDAWATQQYQAAQAKGG